SCKNGGKLGRSRGLEPPTPGTTNQCSNQLSYDRLRERLRETPLQWFPSARWPLRVGAARTQARPGVMNRTIPTFGYPDSLVTEYDHWVVLVRPDQVTLGSLVLAAKSEVTAYGGLSPEAFAEQGEIVAAIENALRGFVAYEKINYLMLMMVDPNP